MALPRRKHSKARGRRRRTHWKVKVSGLMTCPQCHAEKLSHRICPSCGYYKGKPVMDFESKKARKEEKRKKRT